MVDPQPTDPPYDPSPYGDSPSSAPPSSASPDSAPPYHDPWASTVSLPGSPPPANPLPTTPLPATPPTTPMPAVPPPTAPPPGSPAATSPMPPLAPMPAPTGPVSAPTGPVSAPGYAPPPQHPYPGLANAYPGVANAYPANEPVIIQIGEIQVTATTIRTPAGNFPLQGSQWTVTDQWTTEQKIPTWAIVLAIVLFFCVTVFSLLFLLAKETTYRAVVQVHVVNGPYQYVARIPAADQSQVQYLYQQVNYVRSLATG